jgi:uncharacterized membrane protein
MRAVYERVQRACSNILNPTGRRCTRRDKFPILRGMEPLDFAAVRQLLAQDLDGQAVRAIIRCLRQTCGPMSQALGESLSPEDRKLGVKLLDDARQTEMTLAAAWRRMHPGRSLGDAG